MRPLSRGSFLLSGSAALAATALPPGSAFAAPAGEITAGGIALSIGQSLASGAIGSVGDFAFGSIMSAMGLDLSGQGAMNAKLDAILAKLDALQKSVNELTGLIEAEFSQLEYDQAYSSVAPLVATNATLSSRFADLLKLDPKTQPGQVLAKKLEIQSLIKDPSYLRGVATWHNSLVGNDGQTSLLRAWGKAVFHEPSASIFDQAQAAKIQARWDAFDAQQALTVAYIVDYYNGKLIPEPGQAKAILAQWWANRKVQLQAVRGCVKKVDVFPQVDNGNVVNVTTNLRFMPDTMVYSRASNRMWCTAALGPYDFSNMNPNLLQIMVARMIVEATQRTGTAGGWTVPSADDLYSFAQECGGHFGFGFDIYTPALISHGFAIPGDAQLASNCRIFPRPIPGRYDPTTGGRLTEPAILCKVLNEGGTPGDAFSSNAYVLLNRPLQDGESYWYS